MNWSKLSAILGVIVLVLVGAKAAIDLHNHFNPKPCQCPQ